MSKTLQGHHTKLKRKEKQTKRQNRRQSVVAGRQQLYCAVQSRSPSQCPSPVRKRFSRDHCCRGRSKAQSQSTQLTIHTKCTQNKNLTTYACITDWLQRQLAHAFRRRRRYSISISTFLLITNAAFSSTVFELQTEALAPSLQHNSDVPLSNDAQTLFRNFSAMLIMLLMSCGVKLCLQTNSSSHNAAL